MYELLLTANRAFASLDPTMLYRCFIIVVVVVAFQSGRLCSSSCYKEYSNFLFYFTHQFELSIFSAFK